MQRRPNGPREIICYNCNKKGHIAPRCPEKVEKPGKWQPQRRPISHPTLGEKFDKLEQQFTELKSQLAKLLENQSKTNQNKTENEQVQAPVSATKQNTMLKAIRDATEALIEQEHDHLN